MNAFTPNILPVQRWASDGLAGDIALHSPTTGVFLGDEDRGENERPPEYFIDMPAYAEGYRFWKERGAPQTCERLGELTVCLYLTDPNDPEGLGHPDDLEYLLGCSDMVGYALGRSVNARLTDSRRIARVPGLVIPDPAYERKLNDTLYEFDPFSFDLPADAPAVSEMERTLFDLAERQGDPANPAFSLMLADMVYCNTVQWAMAGAAGIEPAKQPNRAISMLLITSPEHADLGRKISLLGTVTVEVVCATPEIEHDSIHVLYNKAISTGIVPAVCIPHG